MAPGHGLTCFHLNTRLNNFSTSHIARQLLITRAALSTNSYPRRVGDVPCSTIPVGPCVRYVKERLGDPHTRLRALCAGDKTSSDSSGRDRDCLTERSISDTKEQALKDSALTRLTSCAKRSRIENSTDTFSAVKMAVAYPLPRFVTAISRFRRFLKISYNILFL